MKMVSNSPRDGPELAKIVSVDDQHLNAPWGSTTMEIASGPQNLVIDHETGRTKSVDDRHVSVPWCSTITETALGPQNGE